MICNSSDQDQQLLVLQVFGHIALQNEGKKMLFQNNIIHSFSYLGKYLLLNICPFLLVESVFLGISKVIYLKYVL